jgi:SSS family solute:Na+ symporter
MVGRDILDTWWKLSGIFAGGMLGLFLLGLISRRAGSPAAATGVALGLLAIFWMTFSPASRLPEFLRSPFHSNMIIVVGTLTIFFVGLMASRLFAGASGGQRKRPGA